ncbi:MAG: MerR family transcriptional regulator [Chloroflexi bacterium]|nr:MerR family transcriptional regulator [Chloroflexota bacterium]
MQEQGGRPPAADREEAPRFRRSVSSWRLDDVRIPGREVPARRQSFQGRTLDATDEGAQEQHVEFQGLYIISVAARLLEMHPQTLRKYERMGLVMPSRTVGKLRLYSQEDIVRLRLIKHLVEEVGLNTAGVTMVMSLLGRLTDFRRRLRVFQSEVPLRDFLEQEVDNMLELLNARFFFTEG